jgi:glycosyltransferase involved in cell wall biosynthesis
LRLLHIDTESTWRGGENQLRLLLEGLAAAKVESHLALRRGSAAAARLKHLAPCLELSHGGGFDPLAAWRISRYCRAHGIELLDAHTANAHALALLVKALAPELKLVVHRRVDNVPSPSRLTRAKYLSPKVDRYVAISAAIRAVLSGYGVPADRLRVVKSAINTSHYKDEARPAAQAELRRAYGLAPGAVLVGNASALTRQKGYEVLLDAAALLKQQGVPFHVLIAGDGELAAALERQRRALGLEHHVTFLGFIQDVPRFLSGLDVLAAPSNWEGLGTIILEGIAAGLAVAATSVGGIPEVIVHEDTGLLGPVGDAQKLAANLGALIQAPDLRRRLNAKARAHIAKEFSVAAMVQGNLAVYRELLGTARLGG